MSGNFGTPNYLSSAYKGYGSGGVGQSLVSTVKNVVPNYYSEVNGSLKKLMNANSDVLQLLEMFVRDFSLCEFGCYEPSTFMRFVYTSLVQQMTNGNLSGIRPDIDWYNPKFMPPQNINAWIPISGNQNTQQVNTAGNSELDMFKSEIADMKKALIMLIQNNKNSTSDNTNTANTQGV